MFPTCYNQAFGPGATIDDITGIRDAAKRGDWTVLAWGHAVPILPAFGTVLFHLASAFSIWAERIFFWCMLLFYTLKAIYIGDNLVYWRPGTSNSVRAYYDLRSLTVI